jgi:hypothetical protein
MVHAADNNTVTPEAAPAPRQKQPLPITGRFSMALSARVADMMNRTYGNAPNPEDVDLTLGKFLYLLGNGLLDRFPENLGYIELASRSKSMQPIKEAADFIKNGGNPGQVFPDIHHIPEKTEMAAAGTSQNERSQDGIKQILAAGTSNYQGKLASSASSPNHSRV